MVDSLSSFIKDSFFTRPPPLLPLFFFQVEYFLALLIDIIIFICMCFFPFLFDHRYLFIINSIIIISSLTAPVIHSPLFLMFWGLQTASNFEFELNFLL